MTLALLFIAATQAYNLPPNLLKAVCFVESKYDIGAILADDHGSPSIGVCQVKLATSRLLGFKGPASALRSPEINTQIAASYLRRQLDRYHGDIYKAISAYNSGTYRVGQHSTAKNHCYVNKVLTYWSHHAQN